MHNRYVTTINFCNISICYQFQEKLRQDAIASVDSTAKTAAAGVTSTVTSETAILKEILGTTLNKINGVMQNVTNSADELGHDAALAVEKVGMLVNQTVKGFQEAGDVALAEIREIADEFVTQVNANVNSQIVKLYEDFQACTNVLCKVGVISRASSNIQDLQKGLVALSLDARQQMAEVLSTFSTKLINQVSSTVVEGTTILNEFLNSVASKVLGIQ